VAPEAIFDRFVWAPFDRAAQIARYDTDRTVLERARQRAASNP
jgi:hypothetical protein